MPSQGSLPTVCPEPVYLVGGDQVTHLTAGDAVNVRLLSWRGKWGHHTAEEAMHSTLYGRHSPPGQESSSPWSQMVGGLAALCKRCSYKCPPNLRDRKGVEVAFATRAPAQISHVLSRSAFHMVVWEAWLLPSGGGGGSAFGWAEPKPTDVLSHCIEGGTHSSCSR